MWLNNTNRENIFIIINQWYENNSWDEELELANVASIYKKGDASNLANYRPISLLNTMYKLFATILKIRIEEKLDENLQKTQYGFRENRSTADALHIIRRAMDLGDAAHESKSVILLLLDWEKAFDKVLHEGLFNAMHRMGINEKLIRLTKKYTKTQNS